MRRQVAATAAGAVLLALVVLAAPVAVEVPVAVALAVVLPRVALVPGALRAADAVARFALARLGQGVPCPRRPARGVPACAVAAVALAAVAALAPRVERVETARLRARAALGDADALLSLADRWSARDDSFADVWTALGAAEVAPPEELFAWEDAVTRLEEATRRGHPRAPWRLLLEVLHPEVESSRRAAAIGLVRERAEAGDPAAMAVLGALLVHAGSSWDVRWDELHAVAERRAERAEGLEWLERAGAAGERAAQVERLRAWALGDPRGALAVGRALLAAPHAVVLDLDLPAVRLRYALALDPDDPAVRACVADVARGHPLPTPDELAADLLDVAGACVSDGDDGQRSSSPRRRSTSTPGASRPGACAGRHGCGRATPRRRCRTCSPRGAHGVRS